MKRKYAVLKAASMSVRTAKVNVREALKQKMPGINAARQPRRMASKCKM